MNHPAEETLLQEVADFLTSSPTLDDIIAYRPSATLEARLQTLLEKNRDDDLSDDESAELEQFMYTDHLLIVMKAQARRKLTQS